MHASRPNQRGNTYDPIRRAGLAAQAAKAARADHRAAQAARRAR